MRSLILAGCFCLSLQGQPLAGSESRLYQGLPASHAGVDAFYTYMALLGRHEFDAAYHYRAGVSRKQFLQQVQEAWHDYERLFARTGFTFLGWEARAVDYSEDVGGNTYIRMVQTFRLRKEDRLLLRHAGFTFRVTFSGGRIYTIDPIRGQILGEEQLPLSSGEKK